MMKKILLVSYIILIVSGCTRLGEPTMHPSEWTDQNSEESHIAKSITAGTVACQTCHGEDYEGGISEVSCYQCHNGPSGHPDYSIWVRSSDSPDFHGKDNIERCKTCHGDDYEGGVSEVSCYQCHDGPSGYGCPDFTPPSNHTVLQERDDCYALHRPGFEDPLENGCTICHGTDLTGNYGPSCFICHGDKWNDDDYDDD